MVGHKKARTTTMPTIRVVTTQTQAIVYVFLSFFYSFSFFAFLLWQWPTTEQGNIKEEDGRKQAVCLESEKKRNAFLPLGYVA